MIPGILKRKDSESIGGLCVQEIGYKDEKL